MSAPDTATPFWCRDIADLSQSLGSGPDGLTAVHAAERLARVGPNSLEDEERLGPLRLLWRQIANPLVLILIFAAGVSLSLSQWVDAGIILAIVIGSSLLGFYQEFRASAAVEALKKRLALTCRVVRHGVEGTVHAETLVPGDVLVLSAGNHIAIFGRCARVHAGSRRDGPAAAWPMVATIGVEMPRTASDMGLAWLKPRLGWTSAGEDDSAIPVYSAEEVITGPNDSAGARRRHARSCGDDLTRFEPVRRRRTSGPAAW